MSDTTYYTKESSYSGIADAIREQLGETDEYSPLEMPDKIRSIGSGGDQVWEQGTGDTNSAMLKDSGGTASGKLSVAEGYNTVASGNYSHAEGSGSYAIGEYAHAEGRGSNASGKQSHAEGESIAAEDYAHSEGESTKALGYCSHAEGETSYVNVMNSHVEGKGTTVVATIPMGSGAAHAEGLKTYITGSNFDGVHSEGYQTSIFDCGRGAHVEGNGSVISSNDAVGTHVEGDGSQAIGDHVGGSHAEGQTTTVSGIAAHTEGNNTYACGLGAHAEGYVSQNWGSSVYGAFGNGSHSEGGSNRAVGTYSHTEGTGSIAEGYCSHAEGQGVSAKGDGSHAEGLGSRAAENYSHAEGTGTYAANTNAHAEGEGTQALGKTSHAEGFGSCAYESASHVEGKHSKACGKSSHAEGYQTYAWGPSEDNFESGAHAEGIQTTALGDGCHAEGRKTYASGICGHVEGIGTTAYGQVAHAEGCNTYAHEYSHAEGVDTSTLNYYTHAEGYNSYNKGGTGSHSEGHSTTIISGSQGLHSEGFLTYNASKSGGHVEGYKTSILNGCEGSHVEGACNVINTPQGWGNHIEGEYGSIVGSASRAHVEGYFGYASNYYVHVEGDHNAATGTAAHAEGIGTGLVSNPARKFNTLGYYGTTANLDASISVVLEYKSGDTNQSILYSKIKGVGIIAQGLGPSSDVEVYLVGTTRKKNYITIAKDEIKIIYEYDIPESYADYDSQEAFETALSLPTTILGSGAFGEASHCEGWHTTASGHYSHTEGRETYAGDYQSHAEGYGTVAKSANQHVQGKYNIEDTENTYAHIVGNGSDEARSNAHTLDWDGNAWFAGDVKASDENGDEVSLVAMSKTPSLFKASYDTTTFSEIDAALTAGKLPICIMEGETYTYQSQSGGVSGVYEFSTSTNDVTACGLNFRALPKNVPLYLFETSRNIQDDSYFKTRCLALKASDWPNPNSFMCNYGTRYVTSITGPNTGEAFYYCALVSDTSWSGQLTDYQYDYPTFTEALNAALSHIDVADPVKKHTFVSVNPYTELVKSLYCYTSGSWSHDSNVASLELPVASISVLGGVKVGNGLGIDASGNLSITSNINSDYSMTSKNTGGFWLDGKKIIKKTCKITDYTIGMNTIPHGILSISTIVKTEFSCSISGGEIIVNADHTNLYIKISDVLPSYLYVTLYYTLEFNYAEIPKVPLYLENVTHTSSGITRGMAGFETNTDKIFIRPGADNNHILFISLAYNEGMDLFDIVDNKATTVSSSAITTGFETYTYNDYTIYYDYNFRIVWDYYNDSLINNYNLSRVSNLTEALNDFINTYFEQ